MNLPDLRLAVKVKWGVSAFLIDENLGDSPLSLDNIVDRVNWPRTSRVDI